MNDALEHEVLADMSKLEQTLTEDLTGDRARAMLQYFDQVAQASEQMVQKAAHDAERQLAAQLQDGFRASQRIVRHVWETLHSASLPA
ncbi:hypothetical protein M8A51_18255 [Schlegelella sp. S2-27]|uniref:Uncharacterized protein n=1 Tax=Caldimonas mangrovi TaxID=2944811 RepID=A0ABT0YRW9_9BURK|nr:hypothetical protein [Caldimonas mangrovi]MCM5681474.1 hypothetical protein [Caldimonas mangrovi]